MHLMGHLQPTQLFFWPGDGQEPGLRWKSLGWCNLRLHFQRRGHEGKCVAMVPDPKKAWGGRGDLQSARLGSSVAMKGGEQQDREHWPGPLLSSSTEERPQCVTTGSPETSVCPLGEQRRGRVFPSRPLLPWGSAGT